MENLKERRNTYGNVVSEFGKYKQNFEDFCNSDGVDNMQMRQVKYK